MKFLWPSAFFLFSLVPMLIAAYLIRQRRRRRYAIRYSSLSLVRAAAQSQSKLRRYLPLGLFSLALLSLVASLARPVAVTLVPSGRATVMLTLDISRSMLQNDIPPSRLRAAEDAALSFIRNQNSSNQIGVVAFAGIAQMVAPPSTDPEELESAIISLTTGRGTAIGSGIIAAMNAIDEYNQSGIPNTGSDGTDAQPTPLPEGEFLPDIIVLLTDGVFTTGTHPLVAAQLAADRGIRVYTIGFGTAMGQQEFGNNNGGGGFFGGGGGGGRRFRRGIDEQMLKAIATMTGGEYYAASSAPELQKVFDSLPTFLTAREETTEISVVFAALGALLTIIAVLLATRWHPLP